MNKPHLITFSKIGLPAQGYLSVLEANENIPFSIKRIFYTYFTPEDIVRGRHAHHETEMVIIACAGRIVVNTEMPNGEHDIFVLDKPETGVFLPKYCWHTMQYSHNAVQVVIASTLYEEKDYIRNYDDFKKIQW
jgi:dTDP-4-dehydrorhamnose 3,5-epimerase-like enzyme